MAEQNCQPYPNVHLLQGGIWFTDAMLGIQNPDAESWAYCVGEVDPSTPGALRGYSLTTLAEMAGFAVIDLLKLDIEGAETVIFSHPERKWLEKVTTLVVEIHGEQAHEAVLKALGGQNFQTSQQGEKLIFTRVVKETTGDSMLVSASGGRH